MTKSGQKKVLIISYHFPPDAAVGAIRPSKFCKFLPEFGWQPIVLTVKDRYYEKVDPESLNVNNRIPVFKTTEIPTIKEIYLSLKGWYLKRVSSESLTVEKQKWAPDKSRLSSESESIVAKVHRYFNSLFVWLPDEKIGWVPPAFLKGVSLLQQQEIDAIITSGPPHSAHLVGLLLRLFGKRPWIVDFRNPWAVETKPYLIRSAIADRIENWLLEEVIQRSDYVVCTTDEMSKMTAGMHVTVDQGKFITIYNGYDPDELKEFKHLAKFEQFTMTYAGTFYIDRNPELFLQSLSECVREGSVDRNDFHVKFIGECRYIDGKSVEKMVSDANLKDFVTIIDQIPHRRVLEEMARSHALLLYPNPRWAVPGKVFEYIGLRSTILAVCGEGAVRNLLNAYPATVFASPTNKDEIKKAIEHIYERCRKRQLGEENSFPFTEFERRRLTERLADLLDRAAGS